MLYVGTPTLAQHLVQADDFFSSFTGTADLGNTLSGVQIDGGASSNTIGGTTAAARNLISGNDEHGVYVVGPTATGNLVQDNYIGTNANGIFPLANTLAGVRVANAGANSIGGTAGGVRTRSDSTARTACA